MTNRKWQYKCIICGELHKYGKIYHEKDEYDTGKYDIRKMNKENELKEKNETTKNI